MKGTFSCTSVETGLLIPENEKVIIYNKIYYKIWDGVRCPMNVPELVRIRFRYLYYYYLPTAVHYL